MLVRSLSSTATAEDIAALMEDSEKQVAIAKGKEEKKKWDEEQIMLKL